MFRLTSRLRIVTLILTFTLAACGGAPPSSTNPKTVTLTLNEFLFQPAEITANVGQPIKLIVQ